LSETTSDGEGDKRPVPKVKNGGSSVVFAERRKEQGPHGEGEQKYRDLQGTQRAVRDA
jgi:hypothetical protein